MRMRSLRAFDVGERLAALGEDTVTLKAGQPKCAPAFRCVAGPDRLRFRTVNTMA